MTTRTYTKNKLNSQASSSTSGASVIGVKGISGLLAGADTFVQAALEALATAVNAKVSATRAMNTSSGGGTQGGGDLSADRTITLTDTAVAPGSYTLSSITVDQKGRLTSASSGSPGSVADASTTVKGATKVSTAPVSATNPIAVGDNDGRVPTQGENDALVGTSGTPSSSNKFVTNADNRMAIFETIPFSIPGTLSVTAGKGRYRVTLPTGATGATVIAVTAQLDTPSSSGSVTFDVNKALAASLSTKTTLYTTQGNRPSIAANGRDASATLPDVTTFANGDHITVDVDAVGTASADGVVCVRLRYDF